MKALLVRLSGQTFVYGLSGAALSAVGLVTLPVLARALSKNEYGALEIAAVAVSVFGFVVDLGLGTAAQRSYFDYRIEQSDERRTVLSTAIITSSTIAFAIAVVVASLARPISGWLLGDEDYAALVVVSIVALPVGIVAQLFREVMRLTTRPWHYLASSSAAAVVAAAVGIVAVTALDTGPTGVQVGAVAGALVAAVYGFRVVRRDLGLRFSLPELRVMLRYGLPLVPAGAAIWGLFLLDRVLLVQLTDLDEVGVYGVANRVASILMFGVVAFGTAYVPFFLGLHAEDAAAERLVRGRICTYVTLTLFMAALVLALFAEEAIAVVAPGYGDAAASSVLLLGAIAAYGVGSVALAGLYVSGSTGRIAVHTAIALLVNVVACLALIPPFGQIGAAAATLAAYAVLTVLYFWSAQRLDAAPFEFRRLFAIVAVTAVAAMAAFVPWGSELAAVPAKLAVLVTAVALLWPLGVVGPMERQFLRETLTRTGGPAG